MKSSSTRLFHLASLGCARNQVDSEIMLGRLAEAGWAHIDDPSEAHVIVVNTCCFITDAADESIDAILELARYKEAGACHTLIVTGCLPERYREQTAASLPEVDVFLGTGAYDRIIDAVTGSLPRASCLLPDPDRIALQSAGTPRDAGGAPFAYIKIAEGCSRQCTYCIIPKLRGRQKSRPAADIVTEAAALSRQGIKELILVAQDTTAYGLDRDGKHGLADLLSQLAAGCPDTWIRLLYGHPESLGMDVIDVMGRFPNLCRYVDIPIQHASDPVLRRMGRRYGQKDLLRLFDDIRQRLPGVALRTTIITGFPGETDADVAVLQDLVARVRFDHLGVFIYSDADDLPSHGLPGHVPAAVARRRSDALMQQQLDISAAINEARRGSLLDVLVEENPEPGLFMGRTMFQAPEVDGLTIIHGQGLKKGGIYRIRVVDSLEYDLIGEPE
ncbi:MAG: 30S ribosomal protein S12 methylthiotransferase RimO [Pseudomonadota bacterium]